MESTPQDRSTDLVVTENLLGFLVHDLNGPLGIGVTGGSFIVDMCRDMLTKLEAGQLSRTEFIRLLEETMDTARTIETNLMNASEMASQARKRILLSTRTPVTDIRIAAAWDRAVDKTRIAKRAPQFVIECDMLPRLAVRSREGVLSAVFAELLDNAVTHAYDQGSTGNIRAWARIDEGGGNMQIGFRDAGKGMPEEIAQHAFHPHFQSEYRDLPEKIGLGLVNRLVSRYLEGSVKLNSSPGHGTELLISIPASLVRT